MEVNAVKRMPDVVQRTSGDRANDQVDLPVKDYQQADQAGKQEDKKEVNRGELEQAVTEINQKLALHNTRLVFAIHDKTHAVMVKVVNADTGETVREVPPKKVLDIRAMTMEELGLLVDEKA